MKISFMRVTNLLSSKSNKFNCVINLIEIHVHIQEPQYTGQIIISNITHLYTKQS